MYLIRIGLDGLEVNVPHLTGFARRVGKHRSVPDSGGFFFFWRGGKWMYTGWVCVV